MELRLGPLDRETLAEKIAFSAHPRAADGIVKKASEFGRM